jgi:hypothetical protein
MRFPPLSRSHSRSRAPIARSASAPSQFVNFIRAHRIEAEIAKAALALALQVENDPNGALRLRLLVSSHLNPEILALWRLINTGVARKKAWLPAPGVPLPLDDDGNIWPVDRIEPYKMVFVPKPAFELAMEQNIDLLPQSQSIM